MMYVSFLQLNHADSVCDGNDAPVSPHEKNRMAANHLLAKIRLQHKKTCALHPSIGASWFQAIELEFKKPYFTEVFSFFYCKNYVL